MPAAEYTLGKTAASSAPRCESSTSVPMLTTAPTPASAASRTASSGGTSSRKRCVCESTSIRACLFPTGYARHYRGAADPTLLRRLVLGSRGSHRHHVAPGEEHGPSCRVHPLPGQHDAPVVDPVEPHDDLIHASAQYLHQHLLADPLLGRLP